MCKSRKHALNKQYALNSKLRLLARVYGITCSLMSGCGQSHKTASWPKVDMGAFLKLSLDRNGDNVR